MLKWERKARHSQHYVLDIIINTINNTPLQYNCNPVRDVPWQNKDTYPPSAERRQFVPNKIKYRTQKRAAGDVMFLNVKRKACGLEQPQKETSWDQPWALRQYSSLKWLILYIRIYTLFHQKTLAPGGMRMSWFLVSKLVALKGIKCILETTHLWP